MKVIAVGREEDPASVREAAPGKQWQEALRANGRGERAAVRLRSGARGCRREAGKMGEGSVLELRGAPAAAAAAAAAAKRPCCVVCGAGGGGGGSKAERGDGRDTTHTAQDGRRGSSTQSCQTFCRGQGARWLAESCTRAARKPAGAGWPWLRRGGPRTGAGARGRDVQGCPAHDAESWAAAAAAEARRSRPPGPSVGGRLWRVVSPGIEDGDQKVPVAESYPVTYRV
ncbi:uncharacterized protein LOC113186565 [Urocitellus parryii]